MALRTACCALLHASCHSKRAAARRMLRTACCTLLCAAWCTRLHAACRRPFATTCRTSGAVACRKPKTKSDANLCCASDPDHKSLPKRRVQHESWLARFLVTKHSWKGKYSRILCISAHTVSTLNPGSFEVTNEWSFVADILDITRSNNDPNEFTVQVKASTETYFKSSKVSKLTFTCDHRSELLTSFLRVMTAAKLEAGMLSSNETLPAVWWAPHRREVLVAVSAVALEIHKGNSGSSASVTCYQLKDIEAVRALRGADELSFVLQLVGGRIAAFSTSHRSELLRVLLERAKEIGVSIRVGCELELEEETKSNLSRLRTTANVESSLLEVEVTAFLDDDDDLMNPLPQPSARRTLTLTKRSVIERDPYDLRLVSIRPLDQLFAVLRHPVDQQRFGLQYASGGCRQYAGCACRDDFLASALAANHEAGGHAELLPQEALVPGLRLRPLAAKSDPEVEAIYLRALSGVEGAAAWDGNARQLVAEFNANVPASGLSDSCVAKWGRLVSPALTRLALLGRAWGRKSEAAEDDREREGTILVLRAMERLLGLHAGVSALVEAQELGRAVATFVWAAASSPHFDVACSALSVLESLLQLRAEPVDLWLEQACKRLVLHANPIRLTEIALEPARHGSGAILLARALEALCLVLCAPFSETTEPDVFAAALSAVCMMGRPLFKLVSHRCLQVARSAAALMRTIFEEGSEEDVAAIRQLALTEGAVLEHLHLAIFTPGTDGVAACRHELARGLVACWATGHASTMAMLGRALPPALLRLIYLSPQADGSAEMERATWTRDVIRSSAFVARAGRKPRDGVEAGWRALWAELGRDHSRAELIWNQRTRNELRDALATALLELKRADAAASDGQPICWNHAEFEVTYASLDAELHVGGVYLRVLLDGSPKRVRLHDPARFFDELYHRLLWETAPKIRLLCMQGMAVAYSNFAEQIGPFSDVAHLAHILRDCKSFAERDQLVLLLAALLVVPANAKPFLRAGGLHVLVELLTTAHLDTHVSEHRRSNRISTSEALGGTKEWLARPRATHAPAESVDVTHGPFDTCELRDFFAARGGVGEWDVHAQGTDGPWEAAENVAHVKWALLAVGEPLLSYSQLGTTLLDMLLTLTHLYPTHTHEGALIHPMPAPKRELSAAAHLPHLVQLLLLVEPSVVERAATLLHRLVEANPCLPRLHLTGAFFFAFMYTGSNILPLVRFIRAAHAHQRFVEERDTDELCPRSFLNLLLPQALVCCLESAGVDKFAEVFLGNFDTPEYIWSDEMRRHLVEQLSLHVGDLPLRLNSNCATLYRYCPMAPISYFELKDELFCHQYYLRNLCDTQRFGNWPIREPIQLLQAILARWYAELQQRPASMSREDALSVLGVDEGVNETTLRRAYHRLAAKYHPDKNAEADAREHFEHVQRAYERISLEGAGPGSSEPYRLSLLLRAQVILYERCGVTLQPYKYAGYPMLLKVLATLDSQSFDLPRMFNDERTALLCPACQLLDATLRAAPLNADELRRVGGLESVCSLFRHCVSLLTPTTDREALPVACAIPLLRALNALSTSSSCRERLCSETNVRSLADLVRCLHFLRLPTLCELALDAIAGMCEDAAAKAAFVEAGVIWHLLRLMTRFDFTLANGGVEACADTNLQLLTNQRAKQAVNALQRLAGYPGTQTSPNLAVQRAIEQLITEPLAQLLSAGATALGVRAEVPNAEIVALDEQILSLLNTSSETPYLLWDAASRSQLVDFLDEQLRLNYASPAAAPLSAAERFELSSLKDELKVGSVFVRVFNSHPSFPLHDASDFCAELLQFLAHFSPWSEGQVTGTPRVPELSSREEADVTAALRATELLLEAHYQVEDRLLMPGRLDVLLSFALEGYTPSIRSAAVQVGRSCTAIGSCAEAIAEGNGYLYLFPLLRGEPDQVEELLLLFVSLAAQPRFVARFVSHGAILQVLYLFASQTLGSPTSSRVQLWSEQRRALAGSLLSRLTQDPTHGQRVLAVVRRIMPLIFLRMLGEDTLHAVRIFDSVHENPELIWTDGMRAELRLTLEHLSGESEIAQRADPMLGYTIDGCCQVEYPQLANELCIGDVYIRLLLEQPAWQLRNPKDFLQVLLQAWAQMVEQNVPDPPLGPTSRALLVLLQGHPALCMHVVTLGYVPKILDGLTAERFDLQRSCARLLRLISQGADCVRAMRTLSCIMPCAEAMESAPALCDEVVPALVNLMGESDLVRKALEARLVPFMLTLLMGGLEQCEDPSAVKAHAVRLLKKMANDPHCGMSVQELLNEDCTWDEFKLQEHDLYLTSESSSGLVVNSGSRPSLLTQ